MAYKPFNIPRPNKDTLKIGDYVIGLKDSTNSDIVKIESVERDKFSYVDLEGNKHFINYVRAGARHSPPVIFMRIHGTGLEVVAASLWLNEELEKLL